jgi:uncharacterized protein YjdB
MGSLFFSDSVAGLNNNVSLQKEIKMSVVPHEYREWWFIFSYKTSSFQLSPEKMAMMSGLQSENALFDSLGLDTKQNYTPEERARALHTMVELFNGDWSKPAWMDRIRSVVAPFIIAGQLAQAAPTPIQQSTVQQSTPANVARIFEEPPMVPWFKDKNQMFGNQNQRAQQLAGFSQFKGKVWDMDIRGGVEYSELRGAILKWGIITPIGNNGAVAVDIRIGKEEQEILAQAGMEVREWMMLKISFAHLRQFMEFSFPSGMDSTMMSQNTLGATLRVKGGEVVKFFELSGYRIQAGSHDFGSKEYTVDTATLYQLWSDPRLVAGATTTGVEGKIQLRISQKGNIRLDLTGWVSSTRYNTLVQTESTTNPVLGADIKFTLTPTLDGHVGTRIQNQWTRSTIGIENTSGIKMEIFQDKPKDGKPNVWIQFGVSFPFYADFSPVATWKRWSQNTEMSGYIKPDTFEKRTVLFSEWARGKTQAQIEEALSAREPVPQSYSYNYAAREFVGERPWYVPYTVNAKVDPTALQKLIVQIDKSILPVGSTIDKVTWDVLIALSGVPGSLIGATNISTGASVLNSFAIEWTSLRFRSKSIETQLAAWVNTIEVETTNQIITLMIEKGSVKLIDVRITAKSVDAPTLANAPTPANITYNGFDVTVNITDADGVRNALCQLQTVAGVNIGAPVAPTNGKCTFTAIAPSTAYKIVTTAQVAQKDSRGNITWVNVSRDTIVTTTALTVPTASFASASLTKLTGDSSFTQTLTTNSPGAVIYTSSNPSTATVNPTTGEVVLGSAWSATITATQAAVGIYAATTATYTVTLTASAVDAITTTTLNASNITVNSVIAQCNITDLDGTTGTCALTGGTGATTWPIWADKSLTWLTPNTPYTITLTGTKQVKNRDGSLTSVPVTQTINFTTTALTVPTASFASASLTKLTGDSSFTQTLTTNSPGAVIYTSSNPSTATVNPTTGEVVLGSAWSATITATQAAVGIYAATTATYTVTLTASAVDAITTTTLNASNITVNSAIAQCNITDLDGTTGTCALTGGTGATTWPIWADKSLTWLTPNTPYTITLTGTKQVKNRDGSLTSVPVTQTINFTTTALTVPTASFASASLTKLTGDSSFTQTLTTNSPGAVIYTSSNPSTATVNPTTGEVVLGSAWSATITATQAAVGIYAATTATYTVTLTASAVDAITTTTLNASNITVNSVIAQCNITDLDGTTGTCALTGGTGATTWPIWADKSLTWLTPNTPYTITLTGTKQVKNRDGSLTSVPVTQTINFTTTALTVPTASFASASLTKLTGDSSFTQTLTTNSPGAVIYTSSNPSTATVNPTTGEVVLGSAWSATITATQAAVGIYAATTATYTVTLTASAVDAITTTTLNASNITVNSAIAQCNITDLDGTTGTCALTGGTGATTWPIWADKSLTWLTPNTPYTITLTGTKQVKNRDGSLTSVPVTQTINFTTTALTVPTASFASASLTKLTGDSSFTQTLTTNSPGAVIYTSSNPSTATVNPTTGEVVLGSAWSATITATQAAVGIYAATTATYTVTLTASAVDAITTTTLNASNITVNSAIAQCNITDLDGTTGTCALTGGTGATTWPIWADKSLTWLTPNTPYTITLTGTKQVKNRDGSLTSVPVTQTINFTTTALTVPTASFASASLTKLTGDSSFTQTLTTNSPGAVIYTSSNPSTATVNPTTGEVVLGSAWSATITATQAAVGIYAATTATYTVTLTASAVDAITTTTLNASNITVNSVIAQCNITDLDGTTGTCALTGGTGATTWPIWADKSLTWLTPNTPYTITLTGTKQVKNRDGSLTSVPVTQTINFTTTALTVPTASFASASLTKLTGDSSFTQTLTTNSPGAVIYTSSNPSTATVNPTTGEVVLGSAWSATITATQAAVGIYAATTATYTVTLNPAPVDSLESLTYPTITATQTSVSFSGGAITDANNPVGFNPSITYVVKDTNGTVVSANNLTASTAYTYQMQYNTYNWATNTLTIGKLSASQSFNTPALISPTISFGSSLTKTVWDANFTRTLTTNSPGTVLYSSNDTNIATVNPNTGEVTIKNQWWVTITASQSATAIYAAKSASYTITVNAAPVVNQNPNAISAISAISATVGTAGSRTLPSTTDPDGNPLTYSIVGSLPSGFSFNANTRILSWTASTSAVSTSLTYRASDGLGGTASRNFTINVTAPADTLAPSLTSSASLGSANIGASANHTLTFDESVASISVGSIPTGMTVTPSGSGSSRTLAISTGASFTGFGSVTIPITVTDAAGNSRTVNVSKTISDVAPVAGGAFASLGDMIVSDNAGFWPISVSAGGVTDPVWRTISYTATGLPSELSINSSTGVISGIYDSFGIDATWVTNFSVIVRASNWVTQINKAFVLSIRDDG